MMVALTLLAAQMAQATGLCQGDLPRIHGQRVAWVNLDVDANFRRVSADVFLRMDGLDAQWLLGHEGLPRPSAMTLLHYDVAVPHSLGSPVTLSAILDGRRGLKVTMADLHENISVYPGGASESYKAATITEATVPNIFGVTSFIVEGRDTQGRTFRVNAPIPNWRWFERETRNALRVAERMRSKKQCGPSIYI